MKRFQFVGHRCTFGLLLFCVLMMGCASTQQQQVEAKQRFVALMNRMVGQMTYEDVLLNWGPPTERKETASEITGIWEDSTSYGTLTFDPEKNLGRGTDYHDWRVRMIFDRKSMRLKSWEELSNKKPVLGG